MRGRDFRIDVDVLDADGGDTEMQMLDPLWYSGAPIVARVRIALGGARYVIEQNDDAEGTLRFTRTDRP